MLSKKKLREGRNTEENKGSDEVGKRKSPRGEAEDKSRISIRLRKRRASEEKPNGEVKVERSEKKYKVKKHKSNKNDTNSKPKGNVIKILRKEINPETTSVNEKEPQDHKNSGNNQKELGLSEKGNETMQGKGECLNLGEILGECKVESVDGKHIPSSKKMTKDVKENIVEGEEKLNINEETPPEVTKEEDEESCKPEQKWHGSEKILCFHGPLIYEAKIQQVEVMNGIPKYFIHYKGWNKNWDEWVPEARMLKFTPANVEIQKDLCRAHEVKEQGKRKKQASEHVFAVPKTPSPVPKKEAKSGRRKSGLKPTRRQDSQSEGEFLVKNGKEMNIKPPDNSVESEEQFRAKLEIKIKVPEELKSYIVDDWLQISRKKRLCVLPAKITADQMINEYTKAKTGNKADKLKNNKEKAIIEVTAGVREYFNVMVPTQLLYRQERAQYEQLLRQEPGLVPCKVYGVVHLLRLFTKLGEMLIYTPLSEKSISLLLFYVHDMLLYMKRNASLLFSLADYIQEPVL